MAKGKYSSDGLPKQGSKIMSMCLNVEEDLGHDHLTTECTIMLVYLCFSFYMHINGYWLYAMHCSFQYPSAKGCQIIHSNKFSAIFSKSS